MDDSVKDVIIIGGGCAGLAAAQRLSKERLDVLLLEAAESLGGRVKQCQIKPGYGLVDLGAEFIHGEETFACKLANERNWGIEKMYHYFDADGTKHIYLYFKGKLISYENASQNHDLSSCLELANEFFCAGTKILNNIDDKEQDDVLHSGTNQDMLSWIRNQATCDNSTIQFLDSWICQSEGEDIDKCGMLECSENEDRFDSGLWELRLPDTYKRLLDYFKEQTSTIKKHINCRVTSIDWTCKQFILVQSETGVTFKAKTVIITVPVSILKEASILFTPNLPQEKQDAINSLQMRAAVKLICLFRHRFWPESLKVVYGDCGPFLHLWMYLVNNEDGSVFYAVSGFATAKRAEDIAHKSTEDIKDAFLKQLDGMFRSTSDTKPASNAFVDYTFYDWTKDKNIKGGYSSPTIGSLGSIDALAKPVNNQLFFAGEACNSTGIASVEAAILTGIRAASEIIYHLSAE